MVKASAQARRAARARQQKAQKTAPLGGGERFKALAESAKAGGAKSGEAVAASVMWKKYGKKGGAALIRKGKRK